VLERLSLKVSVNEVPAVFSEGAGVERVGGLVSTKEPLAVTVRSDRLTESLPVASWIAEFEGEIATVGAVYENWAVSDFSMALDSVSWTVAPVIVTPEIGTATPLAVTLKAEGSG
jgi:hypothetical protein